VGELLSVATDMVESTLARAGTSAISSAVGSISGSPVGSVATGMVESALIARSSADPGTHCEYQSLRYAQCEPGAQHVSPV
jgi:hypothetical protein